MSTYWCVSCGPVLQEIWPDGAVVIHRACHTVDIDHEEEGLPQ